MPVEYREYALALLREEPTHSLPLAELRYRLARIGTPPPGPGWLVQELARDARFQVLLPAAAVNELPVGYAGALSATGVAVEPRVVLATGVAEPAAREPLTATHATLLAALSRDAALQARVSAAFDALEEVYDRLRPADEVRDGAAAPSTSPPRPPRAGSRSERRWRRPS